MERKSGGNSSNSSVMDFTSPQTKKVRAYPRVTVPGRVFIHNQDKLFIAPLGDISQGGAFIEQLVSIPEGALVRVVIKSPKLTAPVQAMGRVIRVIDGPERRGIAICFTQLMGNSREVISLCVSDEVMEVEQRMQDSLKVA